MKILSFNCGSYANPELVNCCISTENNIYKWIIYEHNGKYFLENVNTAEVIPITKLNLNDSMAVIEFMLNATLLVERREN